MIDQPKCPNCGKYFEPFEGVSIYCNRCRPYVVKIKGITNREKQKQAAKGNE